MNKLLVAILVLLGLVLLFHDRNKWSPINDYRDVSNGHSGDGSGYGLEVTFDKDMNTGLFRDQDGFLHLAMDGVDSHTFYGLEIDLTEAPNGHYFVDTYETAVYVDENWDCYFRVGEKCVIGKGELSGEK